VYAAQALQPSLDHQQPLQDLFASFSHRKFLFVRPGGNWGDHLIYLGADYLAKQLGLVYRTVDYGSFSTSSARPEEVIYIHGGGGFSPYTSGDAPKCLRMALQTPGAIVVQGPCTLGDVQCLLPLKNDLENMQAEQLHFFSRERLSREICQKELPSHVRQYLNDDTALYLSGDTLLERVGRVRRRLNLLAIREDVEAVRGNEPLNIWEATVDPARFARSFNHWIRIHASAKSILTNRTHSAICGAILGIPTTMFSNAYHKNRSIWEFSLEKRGVKWLEAQARLPNAAQGDPLLDWIPFKTLRQSWKVNRLAKRLRGIPLS